MGEKQITKPCQHCGVHVVLMPELTTGRSQTAGVEVLREPTWMHLPEGSGFAGVYLHCLRDTVATP